LLVAESQPLRTLRVVAGFWLMSAKAPAQKSD
jgi:hypothetical protein